ncbi:Predicted arabinose efflux permease, MFS family [Caloramator quimbayensis]|uniref:Predicted arabinose efflux permease, MFS family n=1 Tax=Caloramator quimbayensis TaxID=1147123 RepID=A0A1T4Y5S0_9CLOT|nr:MFS transporter [Caloramator quimbayensis]SKA96635.1 Predicted arabinose efflux permease, MFS family [Caloramator quimbayensis]
MRRISNLLNPYRGLPKEIYVIFISRIVNSVGSFVMPLMTLILTQKIGLSKSEAGLYISLAGFLMMPVSILGGKLADTIGRKKLIMVFGFLGTLMYIICGFMKPTINMMYVIMAAGACHSISGPAYDALLADLTTPENRKGAYSLVYMGWNIGFAVGPIIGGFLFERHLPIVFIGDAATTIISLILVGIYVKETINLTKQDIEDEGRALEKREEGSVISVLLRRPILLYFALIIFGYNFVYSQWSFMLPMHASQNFKEMGPKYYGFIASFNGLIVMLFTPIVTKLTEKIKNIRCMFYGGILYAVGFGMLGLISTLPLFFVSAFIFTIGEIVLSINTSPFIANHTPISHRGRMNAVLPMILGLGYTLGPMGMGKALSYISIEQGWIILGGVVFVASLFMRGLEAYDEKTSIPAAENCS